MRDIRMTDARESFVEPMQHLDAEVGREKQRKQQKGDEQKLGPSPLPPGAPADEQDQEDEDQCPLYGDGHGETFL